MGTTVEEIWSAVLAELEARHYGKKSIARHRYLFGQLGKLAPRGMYAPEASADFAAAPAGPRSTTPCDNTMCSERRVVRLADEHLVTGSFDLGRAKGLNPPALPELPDLLRELNRFAEHNLERGIAPDTRAGYWRLAREFALYIESNGRDVVRGGAGLVGSRIRGPHAVGQVVGHALVRLQVKPAHVRVPAWTLPWTWRRWTTGSTQTRRSRRLRDGRT